MAKLPDASSLGQRPTPRSERGAYGYKAGTEGAALAEGGLRIAKAGEWMAARQNAEDDKRDRLESAHAENAWLKGQLDWTDQLDNDPDYTTYEKRSQEHLAKVKAQAAAMITDPDHRALFESKIDDSVTRTISNIRAKADAKARDAGRASFVTLEDQAVENYLRAPDEATRGQVIGALNDGYRGAVGRGFFSAEEAAKRARATVESANVLRLKSMKPQERIGILSDGPSGEGFDRAMQLVAKNEGGFVPSDGSSGAPAIFGINAKWHKNAYEEARRITAEKGEAAGKEYAKDFYKKVFWDKYGIDSLPAETQAVVFDGVVNHRVAFADKLVDAAKNGSTADELIAMRRAEYERLAKSSPSEYGKSLPGWMNRLDQVSAHTKGRAGNFTDFVSPEKRVELLEQARREMGTEVRRDAGEIDNAARMGLSVPREKIEAVAARAQDAFLPDLATDLRQFADVQDAAGAFAKQGLPAQEAELRRLKSSAEGGNLADAPFYGAAQKVYETKIRMLKDEPWAYYAAHGVVQEHEPVQFGSPEAVTAQIMERRADADAVGALEGGRFTLPLLTKSEIEQLKQAYETAPPQQAAAMITSVGQNLNGPERQALARAIAAKSPMAAAALSLEPDKALRLVMGSRAKGEVTEAKVREAANERLKGLVLEPEANETLHDAVYAYYKQLALEKGDVTKEVSDDLLKKAIEEVAGPVVTVDTKLGLGGESKVLSFRGDDGEWADEDRMEDIFGGLTDELLTGVYGALPVASDGNTVGADDIKKRAQFVTAGDGVYVAVYPGLGVVSGKDGRPYEFDARRIEAAQKAGRAAKDKAPGPLDKAVGRAAKNWGYE